MKSKNEIIEILSSIRDDLKEQYGVKSIAIFGSYARNDYTLKSDIDIIIEFDKYYNNK